MDLAPNRRLRTLLSAALLAAVTLAVYWQVGSHEFVNLDDDDYITENPHVRDGFGEDGLSWAFTTGHASNWHPVTWVSHMIDCELWGLDAGAHARVNAALHALNAALLLIVLATMTGAYRPALLAAALFALHPLRVESVAWISERKDVLSTCFWMLTMLAWVRYRARPGVGRYLVVATTLAVGLMAKSMLVTLPAVLVLLDLWPLRRGKAFDLVSSLRETAPLFALSIAAAGATLAAQGSGGAVQSVGAFPVGLRLLNAAAAITGYLSNTLAPLDLAAFYPHAGVVAVDPSAALMAPALVGAILTVGITWLALRTRRGFPQLLVGWLWFLGTSLPVIGLVQVGEQAMADRYTYVPGIGLVIVIAWALDRLATRRPRLAGPIAATAAVVLVLLAVSTYRQIDTWKDSVTLWRHALAVTEKNYLAHLNLGVAVGAEGRLDEAAEHYGAALAVHPDHPLAHNNLGLILVGRGDLEGAVRHFRHSVEVAPGGGLVHSNLGYTLRELGDLSGAKSAMERALELEPEHPFVHNNYAMVLEARGDLEGAVRHYRRAVELDPGHGLAKAALARLRSRMSR